MLLKFKRIPLSPKKLIDDQVFLHHVSVSLENTTIHMDVCAAENSAGAISIAFSVQTSLQKPQPMHILERDKYGKPDIKAVPVSAISAFLMQFTGQAEIHKSQLVQRSYSHCGRFHWERRRRVA